MESTAHNQTSIDIFYLFIAVEIRSQLATSLAYKIISASITAMWAFWNEQNNNNNTNKFV